MSNVDSKKLPEKAECQEMAEAYSRLQSLIESIKLGVIMIDLSFNIILANAAAKAILGKLSDHALDFQDLKEKFQEVDFSHALSYYIREGKSFESQEAMIGRKYFRLFLSPVRDITEKIFLGAAIVLEDVTEQKIVERMKAEIVSITSHQLRTPLSVIKGNLEMVLDGDAGKITKGQREILEEAFWGNERMIRLIGDLMDVSRISEGRLALNLKAVKLENLIKESIKRLASFAKEKNVSLAFKPPAKSLPRVKADPQRALQAFQNLLENAIKYTRPGTKGKVVIEAVKDQKGQYIKVAIKDNGVGIPLFEQDKIFERFFRASNISRLDPGGGTGLGLCIVKAIIEQTGGKIWFESQENKGTTFYFTLPLKKTGV